MSDSVAENTAENAVERPSKESRKRGELQKRSSSVKSPAVVEARDVALTPTRQEVFKTYKLFIGGTYPRSESGRYYRVPNSGGRVLNVARASRKDFRNAVQAAMKGQERWNGSSAYLRGQVLYRIAEMLESRSEQFTSELWNLGVPRSEAVAEVHAAIDTLVHYAGWSDKFEQVISSVNPVASSHFNFSTPEPVGTVGIIAPEHSGLLGLVATLAPVIVGGNSCVVLASNSLATIAVAFAELLPVSDLPAGVVNVLTGFVHELEEHFCSHMELGALYLAREDGAQSVKSLSRASGNLKRVISEDTIQWYISTDGSLDRIRNFQELKTTWHPVAL